MTEAEWLACDDAEPMLEFLLGASGEVDEATSRKLAFYFPKVVVPGATKGDAGYARQQQRYAEHLRDVFGNPFCPARLPPDCLTPVVATLAQAAFDDLLFPSCTLDPVRLSILADALEDAGCTDAILAHLRSPGPHVRGCWAVDLILGKQ